MEKSKEKEKPKEKKFSLEMLEKLVSKKDEIKKVPEKFAEEKETNLKQIENNSFQGNWTTNISSPVSQTAKPLQSLEREISDIEINKDKVKEQTQEFNYTPTTKVDLRKDYQVSRPIAQVTQVERRFDQGVSVTPRNPLTNQVRPVHLLPQDSGFSMQNPRREDYVSSPERLEKKDPVNFGLWKQERQEAKMYEQDSEY
jgi:hypothetical protein